MDVNKKWKTLAIISTCLLILVSFLYAQNLMSNKTAEPEPANETIENEPTEGTGRRKLAVLMER